MNDDVSGRRPQRRRMWATCGIAAMLGCAAPAYASGPEQVEQLKPGRGEWLLEYYGQFGESSREGREHSGTLFYGITDGLALGGELQTSYVGGPETEDGLRFDFDSVVALLRFSDPERDRVGAGLWLQAGLDSDGELARLEARFILEKQTEAWRARVNAVLRRINDEDEEGAYAAYAAVAQHAVTDRLWLGIEGSGQAFRIAGFEAVPFAEGHYLGPALDFEFDFAGGTRLDVGLAYFRRIDGGNELRDTVRISLQLTY